MEYDRILENLLQRKDYLVVGRSVTRTDALDKVLGGAKYTADYIPRGTTVVKVFRSTVPHALIKRIDVSDASQVQGVEGIFTGADVPGDNQIGYALPDQPFLNDEKVHFIGDPIALVCAKDEYAAYEAIDKIVVEYDEFPAHLDIDSAQSEDAVPIHKGGNIALTTRIRKGDAEKGLAEADVDIEETYWSPYQDHTYIEPEAAYVENGAVQCGFCTPGMLISSYALFKENPKPTTEEVKISIEGNICRCTGYTKIIAAIHDAAERMSAE